MAGSAQRSEEIEEFMQSVSPRLFRAALLVCGDRHLAEDLVQTTRGKVFVSWRRVRRARGSAGGERDKTGKAAPDKSAAVKETTGSDKKLRPATTAELQTFYSCADRASAGVDLSSCSARNLADGSVLISYRDPFAAQAFTPGVKRVRRV